MMVLHILEPWLTSVVARDTRREACKPGDPYVLPYLMEGLERGATQG